ncbi:F-box/LRR-repeat protein 2-like [Lineus longissimus]|uniref:F-box/LRR-repeat protein 2-like n=1 Tax=Lineus longissimus TaxID=88925 RepID=UPI002B4E7DE5
MEGEKRPMVMERKTDCANFHGETRLALGKRMAYMLRYGAIQNGLTVDGEGFVKISELLGTHMMRHHTETEVLEEVKNGISNRGKKRYEQKTVKGCTFVRAAYLRRFERNINHEGTKVPRLMESCFSTITTNIKDYDLKDFWDEYLLTYIIHRLKRQKKLNNPALRSILGPAIENLDLEGVYITEATIKLIANRCPDLKFLNLKNRGFLMTDHLAQILLKKIPKLETLNLTGCQHLTDTTLHHLLKYCPNLQYLNISNLQLITQDAIMNFLAMAPSLVHIDIYFNRNIKESMIETIEEISRCGNISVVLKRLNDSDVSPSNMADCLSKFRMVVV